MRTDKKHIPNSSSGSGAEGDYFLCVGLGGNSRYRMMSVRIYSGLRVVPRYVYVYNILDKLKYVLFKLFIESLNIVNCPIFPLDQLTFFL